MIARIWIGRTRAEHAETYSRYVLETGIEGLRHSEGNLGAWLLRRVDGDDAEFIVISLWDSMESIRGFAGADVEKARYYPEDDKYLLEMPDNVTHYTVIHLSMEK
ncbi:MAG: antibiotic biosynthesis monooxygenase [Candidatus Latescibacteria bacterium]|nr:antibiotic biosynthesis monooxygenase [Candidatus Latescibacterota bacterium]NIO57370.1 antibiotic biosynthesis monooxygenase [Candidatus Latescibacterota bacterium]